MATELNKWYLDDGTLRRDPKEVLSNFKKLTIECDQIIPSKCKIFFCSRDQDDSVLSSFNEVSYVIKVITEDLEFLGTPLTNVATKRLLNKKKIQLLTLVWFGLYCEVVTIYVTEHLGHLCRAHCALPPQLLV